LKNNKSVATLDRTLPQIKSSGRLAKLQLIDYTTFCYFGLVILLALIFNQKLSNWYLYIIGHLAGAGVLLLFFEWAARTRFRLVRFAREIYPLIMFSITFKELSLIIQDVFPFWFEKYLLAFDDWLFGGAPTVLVQQFYQPWLTESMAFSYWSYYIILPLGCLIFFLQNDWKMLRSCLFHTAVSMYMCYLAFYIFTARGPQQTLAHLHLPREAVGFFDSIILQIQSAASIVGAAFPSSHVVAVWVVLIFMFKYKKWLGFAVLPIVLALSVSTVYLQYHYAADAIAGVLFVGITYPVGRVLERWFEKWKAKESLLKVANPS